jgi:hypothetical protein
LALKSAVMVFSGLTSKSVATVSLGLASKPMGWIFQFGTQNWQLWFGDLGLKITAVVSLFVPQNQAGYCLSLAPQNQRRMTSAWGTR